MPGGPNSGPVTGLNPLVLMELNPYCRWTVSIATNSTMIMGMLTSATTAPTNIAKPVTSSVRVVSQAMKCGNGTPIHVSTPANLSGPRLNLAQPWAMNPNPMTRRSSSDAQSCTRTRSERSDLMNILELDEGRETGFP